MIAAWRCTTTVVTTVHLVSWLLHHHGRPYAYAAPTHIPRQLHPGAVMQLSIQNRPAFNALRLSALMCSLLQPTCRAGEGAVRATTDLDGQARQRVAGTVLRTKPDSSSEGKVRRNRQQLQSDDVTDGEVRCTEADAASIGRTHALHMATRVPDSKVHGAKQQHTMTS
jgi:hypothetical protein